MRNRIGNIKVVQMKISQILLFYSKPSEKGLVYNTIKYLHTIIYPSLELAVSDDIIRKNPALPYLQRKSEVRKKHKSINP